MVQPLMTAPASAPEPAAPATDSPEVLLSIRSDLDEHAEPAERWLVVTASEIILAGPRSEDDIAARRFPRSNAILKRWAVAVFSGMRAQSVIGAGVLQGQMDGVWVDLVLYSNRLAPAFRRAAERLDALVRHGSAVAGDIEEEHRSTCPNCGQPLRLPGDNCPRCVPSDRVIRRVLILVRPYFWLAVLMGMLSLVAVIIELIPPLLQKYLVDDILRVNDQKLELKQLLVLLAWIVFSLGAVRLIASFLAVWKGWVSSRVGTALTSDLRTAMVEKLQEQSISYHDRNQVGMLMSRVAYDTETMHTLMHQLSSGFLLQVLQLVGIGGMLFWLNPKLAMYTLLPMPIVLAGSWFFSKYLFPRHHRYWDSVGRQAAALTGMLSGIRVVKAFAQESREFERFEGSSHRLRDSRVVVDTATATFSSLMGFVFGLGALIVWYVGGQSVLTQQMSLGDLMAFLAYLAMFYTPLTTLSESTTWISSFLAASHRIFELLDAPALVKEPKTPESLAQFQGQIRFEDVSFSYEENRPVLKHLNFEIEPGTMVGVVGRSGSGKSTLVSLITRFYDVGAGKITLDGTDVRDVSSRELRRKIGMVLQEPFLFEGTVADNITYGNAEASYEQIVRAAKAANAHDFVMRMPFAYENVLGERGVGLSGGERQRLSIARALLYNPQVLILDEATSSVDTESERLIQEAVKRFAKGRTVIAIAHRLSTLKDADRLLVFDQGQLVEQGTPGELLAQNGVYAALVRIQSSFGKTAGHFVAHETSGLHESNGASGHEENGQATAVATEVEPAAEVPDESEDRGDFTWIDPAEAAWQMTPHGELQLTWKGELHRGCALLSAFPASNREVLLSVRIPCEHENERELGVLRALADWPAADQALIRKALNKRYVLHYVRSLDRLNFEKGFLNCAVTTDHGPLQFLMTASREGMKPFGKAGRLLIDLDENHYLIPDLAALPATQRWLLQLHFAE